MGRHRRGGRPRERLGNEQLVRSDPVINLLPVGLDVRMPSKLEQTLAGSLWLILVYIGVNAGWTPEQLVLVLVTVGMLILLLPRGLQKA